MLWNELQLVQIWTGLPRRFGGGAQLGPNRRPTDAALEQQSHITLCQMDFYDKTQSVLDHTISVWRHVRHAMNTVARRRRLAHLLCSCFENAAEYKLWLQTRCFVCVSNAVFCNHLLTLSNATFSVISSRGPIRWLVDERTDGRHRVSLLSESITALSVDASQSDGGDQCFWLMKFHLVSPTNCQALSRENAKEDELLKFCVAEIITIALLTAR